MKRHLYVKTKMDFFFNFLDFILPISARCSDLGWVALKPLIGLRFIHVIDYLL